MFLGTHTPRLDEKGRLILPAKYRDELAEGVVITKGQERCLYVWPLAEFTRVTTAMRDAQMSGKTLRDHSRVLFASASDEVPDKQGRITVPPALRSYAGLERDCVVIGANTRMEIWDAAAAVSSQPSRSGLSPAIFSSVVSRRGPSSSVTPATGVISRRNRPSSMARTARAWLSSANSSS